MPSEPTPALGPRDLRRRLLRLPGLPLRPATARAILARWHQGDDRELGDPSLLAIDPGWVLARAAGAGRDGGGLAAVAEADWWLAERLAVAAPALDRLWRNSLATSRAAWRLAQERQLDPTATASLGLLMNLGAWALAAIEPQAWGWILQEPEPEARHDRERQVLGTDLATMGRDLADRWELPAPLAEAIWFPGPVEETGGDKILAGLLRRARGWAERTPWALGPATRDRDRDAALPDPRLRVLVAEVQVLGAGGLTTLDATEREESLARSHATLAREVEDHRRQAREWSRMARLLEDWRPGDEPPGAEGDPHPVPRHLRRLAADRDRQSERLDSLAESHRRVCAVDAATRAAERLDALAEFAAGAAHELNNPLAVIVGRAQLLMPRVVDDDSAKSLRAIISQAQRAHRILRDLIYVARPPEPRVRSITTADVLRGSLRDLGQEAAARGLRFEWDLGEPTSPVRIDPDAFRHAVDVLVRNALEAVAPGGMVSLTIERSSTGLEATVRDDGPGLDQRAVVHLLDPFYCGRQAGRGLGLGLPRVARWAERAGGSLRWKNRPEGGTTFILHLPLDETPRAAVPGDPGPAVLAAGREATPAVQAIS